jgi:hypothetical protein
LESSYDIGSIWEDEELEEYFKLYKQFPKKWELISEKLETRTSYMCKALFELHQNYIESDSSTIEGLKLAHNDSIKFLKRIILI